MASLQQKKKKKKKGRSFSPCRAFGEEIIKSLFATYQNVHVGIAEKLSQRKRNDSNFWLVSPFHTHTDTRSSNRQINTHTLTHTTDTLSLFQHRHTNTCTQLWTFSLLSQSDRQIYTHKTTQRNCDTDAAHSLIQTLLLLHPEPVTWFLSKGYKLSERSESDWMLAASALSNRRCVSSSTASMSTSCPSV